MASSRSARAHPDLTVSPFEDMLHAIAKADTGREAEVDELVESFLHSARTIADKAGLGKAADGSGEPSSGQWQPNKNVSDEHLQAALKSLDSVRKVLEALNRTIDTAVWLEEYLVSTVPLCPATSSHSVCHFVQPWSDLGHHVTQKGVLGHLEELLPARTSNTHAVPNATQGE